MTSVSTPPLLFSPLYFPGRLFSSGKGDRERHLSCQCFQLRCKLRRQRDPVLQILRPPAEAALPGRLRLALLGRGWGRLQVRFERSDALAEPVAEGAQGNEELGGAAFG